MPAGIGDDQVRLQRSDDLEARRLARADRNPLGADDIGIGGNDGVALFVVGDADRLHAHRGERIDEAVFEHDDALRMIRNLGGAEIVLDFHRLRETRGKHDDRAEQRRGNCLVEHDYPLKRTGAFSAISNMSCQLIFGRRHPMQAVVRVIRLDRPPAPA